MLEARAIDPLFPERSQAERAVMLSVASWIGLGPFGSIPSLLMAIGELRAIANGRRAPQGRGMAIGAVISSVLNLAVVFVMVLMLLFSLASLG